MRSLLLVDEDFLRRERSMLERLEVGLRDAGEGVVWGLPKLDPPAPMGALCSQATFERATVGGADPLSTLAAFSSLDVRYAPSTPAHLGLSAGFQSPGDWNPAPEHASTHAPVRTVSRAEAARTADD